MFTKFKHIHIIHNTTAYWETKDEFTANRLGS